MARPYDVTKGRNAAASYKPPRDSRARMPKVPMCPCCYRAHPPTALGGIIVAHRDADGYRCEGVGQEPTLGLRPGSRMRVDGGEND